MCCTGDVMQFEISRIDTKLGIFRLAGRLLFNATEANIHFSRVEFMGTDGWRGLNLDSTPSKSILSEIEPEIIEHLIKPHD